MADFVALTESEFTTGKASFEAKLRELQAATTTAGKRLDRLPTQSLAARGRLGESVLCFYACADRKRVLVGELEQLAGDLSMNVGASPRR
jgi:hypothetical protein